MFESIEKIELLDIFPGVSRLHSTYTRRACHAFVFRLSGESCYHFPGEDILLAQGQMLFIPQGASYTVEILSKELSRYLVVNFTGELQPLRPKKFNLERWADFQHICSRLSRLRTAEDSGDQFRRLALFYEILSRLVDMEKYSVFSDRVGRNIEPAVEYLREHMFDAELKIGELHTLCGISDTYFRRLFMERFGVGPKQYVQDQRLRQAKVILENGECDSVGQAAELAGFEDSLYFSKVFKKRYGYPPSLYRKNEKPI